MKKALISIFILLMTLSVCPALASEGDMINPYFQEANNPPVVASTFSMRSVSKVTVELTITQEPSLVQDTVITASASGGDGNYQYCFYLLDPTDTSDEYPTGNPHGFRSVSTSPVFRYRLVVPGTYMVLVYAKDGSGSSWDTMASLNFTLKDESAQTTKGKVDELVAKCIAAGCDTDYEKALWFHDWLIENAYYDLTYSYYSADGVLIRGSGVCDSYSKAYLMLLNAVGIEAERVTNVDHAWNLVKLDGEWYHIDPTWDDPVSAGYETSKLSGAEYRMYFGLPDTIMRQDRSFESYSSTTEATGMKYNYFLQSSKISMWSDPLTSQVADSLSESGYAFDLTMPTYYKLENGKYATGKECVVYNLCAYAMDRMTWTYGGQTLPLDFSFDGDTYSGAITFSEDTTLTLPAALTAINAEAFEGAGNYLAVELPSKLTSIGAGAFSNNPNLWKIAIPDSVTSIDATAFSGSDNVTILCSQGSAAEAFATANGIRYSND